MAWPERIVGFLFVLEIIVLTFFMETSPSAGSAEQMVAATVLWRFPAYSLPPIWIVLRMFDLLMAGPARRKRHLIVRPLM